jgi:hypothetical protein
MDQDDPERRIAELERRLAGHTSIPDPNPGRGNEMSSRGAVTRRSFEATAPRMNMRTFAILVVYGGMAAGLSLLFALNAGFHVATRTTVEWEHGFLLGGYGVLGLLFMRSFRVRSLFYPRITIRITGDAIEFSRGKSRAEVFPLIGATLGPWAVSGRLMGTALHLRDGRRRFVLGGQSYVPAGVRLDAKPLWNVDAWMPAPDFGALLSAVYRR